MIINLVKLLAISLTVILLSNCGFPGWAKRMGDKLPVASDAQRCADWICMGKDSTNKVVKNKSEYRRKLQNPKNQKNKVMESSNSIENMNTPSYQTEFSKENNDSKPPPLPSASAIPTGAPSKPPTAEEVKSLGMADFKKSNLDDDMSFDPNFDPELYRPENIDKRKEALKKTIEQDYKDSGLKQHEIEAKWKDDLPEGPLGPVRRSVGW